MPYTSSLIQCEKAHLKEGCNVKKTRVLRRGGGGEVKSELPPGTDARQHNQYQPTLKSDRRPIQTLTI